MKKVMYIVVNQDIEMSKGKIGSMCAHASFDYYFKMYHQLNDEYATFPDFMDDFKYHGDTIIILKAHEKDLLKWESKGFVAVRDRGLTEISPNSITAVNLGVYDKNEGIPKWIQRLRLL